MRCVGRNAEGVNQSEPGVVATPGMEILKNAPLKEVAKDLANAYGVKARHPGSTPGVEATQAGVSERLRRYIAAREFAFADTLSRIHYGCGGELNG